MPAAYSVDLRQRVVASVVEDRLTYEQAAERFKVGVASVDRWVRLNRERGDVSPSAVRGRPPRRLDDTDRELLVALVRESPDATLVELADDLSAMLKAAGKADRPVSTSTLGRELQSLGWTRKKRRSSRSSATRRASGRSESDTNPG